MNIVLIGMPGSGKSAVGSVVAHLLRRAFVETDALIEQRENRSIRTIFSERGEGYFRDLETAAAREAARLDGAVISTGGGMILRPENMAALGKSGVIVFLDRPPEEIAGENHEGRPLLAGGRERVFALYTQRIELYKKYAQYVILSGEGVGETAKRLISTLREEGVL